MAEDFTGSESVVRIKGCDVYQAKGQVATDPGPSFVVIKSNRRSNGY